MLTVNIERDCLLLKTVVNNRRACNNEDAPAVATAAGLRAVLNLNHPVLGTAP